MERARSADQVLAIDVGTQSVRALLFDPRGVPVAVSKVPIKPYVSPRPGWAEQDPNVWWRAIGDACDGLWANPVARRDAVAGVALTTQRATIVAADDAGKALRPAIVWLDQRRTEGLRPISGLWGLAFRAARVTETVARFQADCEANWIQAHEPAVWSRIRRYGLLSSWLTARLVGRWIDSAACQVGYLPFDFKASRWAGRRDWKWQVAAFDPAWLPDLVPPTGTLGELTDEAATLVGLPAGTPLIAAAGDKQCEALGVGALTPNLAALSFGTTASIATTHRRYLEAIPLVELQVFRGFWLVEWFKRELASAEVARAGTLGVIPESLFDELVETVPAGSMGLVLQPHWTPGVRYPGPEAKGAIVGFGDVHGRAHVYRAILEGLAYALRESGERSEAASKVPISELRVAGGGAQSRAAVQIFADVFGRPAARPHTHEASGLGAAIDAAIGLGIHPDAAIAVGEMTRVAETIEPDPAAHALYEGLYQEVYRPLYGRLMPLYRRIRRITGYPPG